MTRREHERMLYLVRNPPPGSKIEAALRYGVDLTLNIESLLLTPHERVQRMESALCLAEDLRRAMQARQSS